MSADDLTNVERLAQHSTVAASLRRMLDWWTVLASESWLAGQLRRAAAGARAVPPEPMLRLAGILLLSSVTTQWVLEQFVATHLRGAAFPLIRMAAGLLGVVLLFTAPGIAAAWRSSTLIHALRRRE